MAIETGSPCGLVAETENRTLSPGTAAINAGAEIVGWAGDVSNENIADFALLGPPAVMTTVSCCEGVAAAALKFAVV
jgi:hypothetical protein